MINCIGLVAVGLTSALSGMETSAEPRELWEEFDRQVEAASLNSEQTDRLASGLAERIKGASEVLGPPTALRVQVVRGAMAEFFEHQYPKGAMATPTMQDAAVHAFGQKMHYALVSPIYVCADEAACEDQFGALLTEAMRLAGLDADDARMLRMRTEPFFHNAHESAFKRVLNAGERAALAEQLRSIGQEHRPASLETRHRLAQDVSYVLFDAFTSPDDQPAEEGVAVTGEEAMPDISEDFFQTMEEIGANLRALEQAIHGTHEVRP